MSSIYPSKVGRVRDYRIDLLKTWAIIAVVLFHCGILTRGYLGVDIFFVISGYFMMKGYLKESQGGKYSYIKSTTRKVIRFWPLIIIVCLLSMALGYFTMLPDDYENLAESVVASIAFANNILSAITAKDYWNISNNYKPLMHLWYIGVLM